MFIRLIAVDVDGTLLDSRGRLPPENLAAIEAALDRGLHVALVTGRSYPFALPIIAQLPPSLLLILSNGAVAKNGDGSTYRRWLLPRAVAARVLELTPEFRHDAALIFDREGVGQIISEGMDWDHHNRKGYYDKNRRFILEQPRLEDALTEDPIQIMYNGSVGRMRELVAELQELPIRDAINPEVTEYEYRDFTLVDIMDAGCSKATALKFWAGDLGIAPSEIMAVGDNLNDLGMLELAGLPVVMGNAVQPLKERGWHVTGTHDEAGLADAIRTLALGADP
jgi:Cof subfamily protein (haloacid dehalogenase superfamily)